MTIVTRITPAEHVAARYPLVVEQLCALALEAHNAGATLDVAVHDPSDAYVAEFLNRRHGLKWYDDTKAVALLHDAASLEVGDEWSYGGKADHTLFLTDDQWDRYADEREADRLVLRASTLDEADS